MNAYKVLAVGFGLVAVAFALAVLDSCGADAPIPIVPTPDNPCGRNGVVCETQHSCCSEGETCGGEPASVGCPGGMCCDIDNGLLGAARDAGQRVVPQRIPR